MPERETNYKTCHGIGKETLGLLTENKINILYNLTQSCE
jgi:hypothetical protein